MAYVCEPYDRKWSEKLRRYVSADKFRKLSKLLTRRPDLLNLALNKKNQTGLHLAAKKGCCDSLQVYLSLGANSLLHDRNQSFPLHYAAKYTLKHYSKSLADELISGLLTRATDILDVPNRKGTTCRKMMAAVYEKNLWKRKKKPSTPREPTTILSPRLRVVVAKTRIAG